jgi:hypothetical protein
VISPQRSDAPPPEELGAILGRLTAAGRPWLAIIPAAFIRKPGWPAASGTSQALTATTAPQTIDVTDMRDAPVSVNPFELEPGCPVQSHVDRLATLFEAAFRPPAPARAALRLGLRRAYADCGWDTAAGAALPGAKAPPGIPCIDGLRRAMLREATELGVDPGQRAMIRGFLDVKLRSLWTGPAAQFLAAGHPADLSGLTSRNVLFTAGDVIDEEASAFLTGVLLIRLAEQLRVQQQASASAVEGRHAIEASRTTGTTGAVVLAAPAGRLRRLLNEIRGYGASIITAESAPSAGPIATAENAVAANGSAGAPGGTDLGNTSTAMERWTAMSSRVALRGRRSAACGLQCRQRPCSGYELHEAELLARADGQVWLRLWGQVLVLAFLTGRPLPQLPVAVRRSWPSFDVRTRECLLATVVQAAIASRCIALRHTYDPRRLEAAVATTAAGLLAAAGSSRYLAARFSLRAGQVWVIPQLRWLHEVDRLNPLGPRRVGREDIAPPLDFELAGLPDWPGIRVGDRLDGLRRHRLCMDSERNRGIAATALLGVDRADRRDREGLCGSGFEADLAIAGIGLGQAHRLRYAERMLGIIQRGTEPGWLEVVLSWPARLIKSGGCGLHPPENADNIRPR